MKEIELFLSRHVQLNRIFILSHSRNMVDIEYLKHCMPHFHYEVLYLDRSSENDIQFLACSINWSETILCPYKVECSQLLAFISYNPRYICGSVYENDCSIFLIWEKCRLFLEEIALKSLRMDKSNLMFDWKKEPDNDCELSIIFPVYNVEQYLDKCLETVTYWSASYVEFLFVDDGSPDNSSDIIKKWASNDSRIKLISKKNGGCASARQYGLERARGRYVGFIDPDDFVNFHMFHILLKKAMSGNFDISLCGYNEYYENTKSIKPAEDYLVEPYLSGCYETEKINELIAYSRVAIWRGIYKKEMLDRNRIHFYTELRRFDDLPFKVETFACARSVVMTNEHMYYYRLEREGQDVSANDERLYIHFDIFNLLNKSILQYKNKRMNDYLQMCKIQTHRYALSKIKPELKHEYMIQAREDLLFLDDYKRTYKVANLLLGKDAAEDYRKIMKSGK